MNETLPTQIIILGGSGDLAKRKLIPALIDLYTHNKLPEVFSIVGLTYTTHRRGIPSFRCRIVTGSRARTLR